MLIVFVVSPVLQEQAVPEEAVKVAVPPAQMVAELTVIVGDGFTVTVAIAVSEQPDVVPITVYDVTVNGVSVSGFVVAPVDHKQVVLPLAVSVAT